MKKLLTLRYSKSLLMMLFISLIVCACSKEEKPSYFHHKISRSLYPLLFNEGSTWIYKNKDNSILDTVVLTRVEIDTVVYGPNAGQGPPGEEQVYVLYYNSSQFGEFHRTLREDFICRGWATGAMPTGVDYLSSHKIGDGLLGAKIADIYDSFIVNGISYSNVTEMYVNEDMMDIDYRSLSLYYVDSVGIIKKIITKSDNSIETWELLKYNVTFYKIN